MLFTELNTDLYVTVALILTRCQAEKSKLNKNPEGYLFLGTSQHLKKKIDTRYLPNVCFHIIRKTIWVK